MGSKKYTALLALTAMMLSSATACGSGSDSELFEGIDQQNEVNDDYGDDDVSAEDEDENKRGSVETDVYIEQTEELPTEPPVTEADNSAWRSEYQAILANVNYSEAAFDLVFIDDDSIPELVVSEGLAHVAGCEIYTMYNGECVSLGNYGVYGEVGYVENSKRIMNANLQQGYASYFVGEIRDGAVVTIFTAFDNTGAVPDAADYSFTLNDAEVTEEEYYSTVDEYFGNADFKWAGRRYPMQSDVIKAALSADPPASYVYQEETTQQPTPAPTEPQTEAPAASAITGRVITQEDDLNVRSGPSTAYEKIGMIAKGSTVTILGETDGWYLIEFGNGTGYVSAEFIAVGSNASVTANTASADTLNYVHIGTFTSVDDAYSYAHELNANGLTDVCVKEVGGYYYVQLGAFADYSNAEALLEYLNGAGYNAFITTDGGIVA